MLPLSIVLAQLNFRVGQIDFNLSKMREAIDTAVREHKANLIVFPELALSGYPPEDLLLRTDFLEKIESALNSLSKHNPNVHVLVGHPARKSGTSKCFNAASVLYAGQILTSYHKQKLPNYGVFDEQRYFVEGAANSVMAIQGVRCGILICEDLWYEDPMASLKMHGVDCVICLNASPFSSSKQAGREVTFKKRFEETGLPLLYVNLVGGQDELVFDGASCVINKRGEIIAKAAAFEEVLLPIKIEEGVISTTPPYGHPSSGGEFLDRASAFNSPPEEGWHAKRDGVVDTKTSAIADIYSALVLGTRDYFEKNHFTKALLGLSGGIDSALTLCIAVDALGSENVEAILLPSEHTSKLSYELALAQIETLQIAHQILSIEDVYKICLSTLKENLASAPNKAHENLQARCRGILLMALSNQTGRLLLTTGNKSEMAVGYATLYGDMCGAFNPLKDVFKTQVYALAAYRNSLTLVIPQGVIDRAPSAELAPNQTDQDTLPPYDVLDTILKAYIEENKSVENIIAMGFEASVVERVIQLLKINEYKRKQAPLGVRVSERAFGKDWRMPVVY